MKGLSILTAVAALGFVAGCSCPTPPEGSRQVLLKGVEPATSMETAREALVAMHFGIETFDTDAGVIRTRPLPGSQFFEVWRSDSVGCYNAAEASLHSTQRTVEMTFSRDEGGTLVVCEASLNRLSLPGHDVRDIGSLPSAFTRSSGGLLSLRMYPSQQQSIEWVPVATDGLLAKRILEDLQRRIEGGMGI